MRIALTGEQNGKRGRVLEEEKAKDDDGGAKMEVEEKAAMDSMGDFEGFGA